MNDEMMIRMKIPCLIKKTTRGMEEVDPSEECLQELVVVELMVREFVDVKATVRKNLCQTVVLVQFLLHSVALVIVRLNVALLLEPP